LAISIEKGDSFGTTVLFFYLLTPGLNLEASTLAMVFQAEDGESPLLLLLETVPKKLGTK
jgi:hypothetical protein